jgi:hypothetical protein
MGLIRRFLPACRQVLGIRSEDIRQSEPNARHSPFMAFVGIHGIHGIRWHSWHSWHSLAFIGIRWHSWH